MVRAIIEKATDKIIGLKKTLRAIQLGEVSQVYIASDVEEHVIRKIKSVCRENAIPTIEAGLTQEEMGKLCEIDVGAAVVSLKINLSK